MKRPKSSVFQFREFALHQNKQVMPLTTDAILLGAWTRAENSVHLLEVGTGTGILSLMMAQRFPRLKITAIDISKKATTLAKHNVKKSPWGDRINVLLQDFSQMSPFSYDHIVSNPPFFNDSLSSPDPHRTQSKHTHTLSFKTLMNCGKNWLTTGGKLSVILDNESGKQMLEYCTKTEFHCLRKCMVRPHPDKKPHRMMLEFIYGSESLSPIKVEELVISDRKGEYTAEFKKLTGAFYL